MTMSENKNDFKKENKFWKPGIGEIITGVLLGGFKWIQTDKETKKSEERKAILLECATSIEGKTEEVVVSLSAQLLDIVSASRGKWKKGVTVEIHYIGKESIGHGRELKKYRVYLNGKEIEHGGVVSVDSLFAD
jgi:hypothetical protein